MASTFELIASQTLGSDSTTVTFSSIPGTYDDVVLICSARTDSGSDADPFGIKFNGSTSNYTSRRLQGDGSSVTTWTGSNTTAAAVNGGTSTASTFGSIEAYIPNYAGSANKSFSVTSVTEDNSAAALIRAFAMLWSDTSAITSIELSSGNGGDFVTGSSFYLFGITKA